MDGGDRWAGEITRERRLLEDSAAPSMREGSEERGGETADDGTDRQAESSPVQVG
jgi:hypothetical protein